MHPYINSFDATDKLFFTLAFIIAFTAIFYKLVTIFQRPVIIGGILSGIILNSLHLPVKYFDINSCEIIGNFGIAIFIMFLGTQFHFKRIIANKVNIFLPLFLIFIPFLCGFLIFPLLVKFNLISDYGLSHKFIVASYLGLALTVSTFSLVIMFVSRTNLRHTKVGQLAIFSVSFEEIVFWIMFGIILIYFQQNAELNINKAVGMILYIIFNVFMVTGLTRIIVSRITSKMVMLMFLICGCLLSAMVADYVNLHQVFGAFVFGVCLPKTNLLIKQIRDESMEFIIAILLPIYFVKTGIEISSHLIFTQLTLVLSIIFIILSLFSKYLGSFLIGKFWNLELKDSIILGSLMGMRGTIEVVILNIGFEIGLINKNIYTALIIMSLITTWMVTTIIYKLGVHGEK